MRFIESIDARIVHPLQIKYFGKTKYGKRISKLQDKFTGSRCFLIGNGPSLQADDLTKLYENQEITFGFNRIYNIFNDTLWRPTFYVSQDEKMLMGCADIVNDLDIAFKFIPLQLKWFYNVDIHDATYFNINWKDDTEIKGFGFSEDCSREIVCGDTVMYSAAQLASYMGIKEIYLIGVDHQFKISQNNQGEIIVDNTVKDYFSDNYNFDKENLYIPNTDKSTLTYVAMKEHCERLGIKVFNATRGGKLEVFPRVEFDELFE